MTDHAQMPPWFTRRHPPARRGIAKSELIPPANLRLRVAGTDNVEWFHLSGEITCEVWDTALGTVGRRLRDFDMVLDFGCGPGRVLRWLQALLPGTRLAGCDADAAALAWIHDQYPNVDRFVPSADGLPPLAIADGCFDLVLAFSVFTHFDVHYQDAWLAELRRVMRPGGMLLVSISGPRMLDYTLHRSGHGNLADLQRHLPALAADGVLHWRGDGWDRHFPDYYHTTFHAHDYVRRHWSQWFDVLRVYDETPEVLPQDVVVLRRRDCESTERGAQSRRCVNQHA